MQGIIDILPHCSLSELNLLKQFLINVITKHQNKQWLQEVQNLNMFTPMEIKDLEQQIQEEELLQPALALLHEWKFTSKLPRIEIGSLERQLISCTNANTVVLAIYLNKKNPVIT